MIFTRRSSSVWGGANRFFLPKGFGQESPVSCSGLTRLDEDLHRLLKPEAQNHDSEWMMSDLRGLIRESPNNPAEGLWFCIVGSKPKP